MSLETFSEYRIYGNPEPQGRPRAARRGGRLIFYDPAKSKKWKKAVKNQVSNFNLLFFPLIEKKEIEISIYFYLKRPKKNRCDSPHLKKPDLSNLVKAVEDALTGLIYKDDSQITHIEARKQYANANNLPGCLIVIKSGIITPRN